MLFNTVMTCSKLVPLFLSFFSLTTQVFAGGNETISHFRKAKQIANEIHEQHPYTIYCNCKYKNDTIDLKSCGYKMQKDAMRALSLEWEHVVPAEVFGQSFTEWKEGSPRCIRKEKKYKGRKCARRNSEFARIEADLYNIWPEVGELNSLRSNFAMAELGAEKAGVGDFGSCKAKIENLKFEPMPEAKGRVARVYMYMDQAYPQLGIISDKNRKLFAAWDKLHPVDDWECKRARIIEQIQGNENPILNKICKI